MIMIHGFSKILISYLFLLAFGCKFKDSPYSANAPRLKKNSNHLELIKEQETSNGSNYKIALISDTHNYYEDLSKLVETINRNGPYSFTIVSGDLTNYGLYEEYDETLKRLDHLNSPYLVTIGNHDLLSNGDIVFEKMLGESDFSLIYKNAHFIFFNNNNWEASGRIPNLPWVESMLASSPSPFRILIAHIPVNDSERFSEQQMREWETLTTAHGINYIINGHNHNPSIDSFGSAVKITVGAPSKGSYFELIISPGGITHKKVSF
jgi:Icc protein